MLKYQQHCQPQKKLPQPKSQSLTDNPIALRVRSAIINNDAGDRYLIPCS
ncbi:hypothetical protein QUA27_12565 [Microcoleus sp. Pol14C6]